jgi:integrase
MDPIRGTGSLPRDEERRRPPRLSHHGAAATFHSLRHTYAKRALEARMVLGALSFQLGHSSALVTAIVYGHFGNAAAQLEVAKLGNALLFPQSVTADA